RDRLLSVASRPGLHETPPSLRGAPLERARGKPAVVSRLTSCDLIPSKNVAAEVLVLDQLADAAVDVVAVDDDGGAALVGSLEGNHFHQPFHHGVQAARADVLGALVNLEGDFRDPLHAVFGVLDGDAFASH